MNKLRIILAAQFLAVAALDYNRMEKKQKSEEEREKDEKILLGLLIGCVLCSCCTGVSYFIYAIRQQNMMKKKKEEEGDNFEMATAQQQSQTGSI